MTGLGWADFDNVVILADRRAGVGRDGAPIVTAGVEAAAVSVEQIKGGVAAGRVTGIAVVHISGHHHLALPVAVEVGDGSRAVGKIGAVALDARPVALPPAALFGHQAFPNTDLAPVFARIVAGVGRRWSSHLAHRR